MFDRQYRLYSRILFAADVVAVLPALYVAYHLRHQLARLAPARLTDQFHPLLLPFQDYLEYVLIFLPIWLVALHLTQRYEDLLRQSLARQVSRIAYFLVISGSLMGLATYALRLEVSRPVFFSFFAAMFVLLPVNRVILYWVLRSRNISQHSQVRIMIVGARERAMRIGRMLEGARKWGYLVVGYIDVDGEDDVGGSEGAVGRIRDLPLLLQGECPADELIFVGTPDPGLEEYEDILRLCENLGIRTRILADFVPASAAAVSLEFLDGVPLITFSSVPEHDLSMVMKRVIDFGLASAGLIALSPLMLVAAAAIKFTSPGPVFYRQERCGLYGRRFSLVKFRTMIDGAEDKLWEIRHLNEMDGPVFKMRNDPRVTPLGRILRRTSIDELPQLWSVIKGEMSIVGPRAPLPEEVRNYTTRQRRRLSVRPGITCLWQVSGRNEVSFERWMEMDLQYIDNWSFWQDLRIMAKTIPAVFTGRGAH